MDAGSAIIGLLSLNEKYISESPIQSILFLSSSERFCDGQLQERLAILREVAKESLDRREVPEDWKGQSGLVLISELYSEILESFEVDKNGRLSVKDIKDRVKEVAVELEVYTHRFGKNLDFNEQDFHTRVIKTLLEVDVSLRGKFAPRTRKLMRDLLYSKGLDTVHFSDAQVVLMHLQNEMALNPPSDKEDRVSEAEQGLLAEIGMAQSLNKSSVFDVKPKRTKEQVLEELKEIERKKKALSDETLELLYELRSFN